MRAHIFAVALAMGLIAGCSTVPSAPASSSSQRPLPASTPTPASSPASAPPATKANLVIEKLRLSELFKGTPVVISLQPDGSLRVDVPLQFSFDTGKAAVKPPLAAVLDRIATGQRNELTRVAVSAPADLGAKGLDLPKERATSVRDYLIAHGLAEARVAFAPVGVAAVVRVVVADASAP